MNEANLKLAEALVDPTYLKQASDARHQLEKQMTILLSQRRLPSEGWDDQTITSILNELAAMDSNNFIENVGAGEREGRIYSDLVRQRNFGFAHGVGRSGELSAVQPKAAGSSLMYKLTNLLALDAIKTAGIPRTEACFVAPLATGMALTLCLSAWSTTRPKARYVIWPRIDQKTCFKCILAAGLIPIVIETTLENDQLVTNLEAIKAAIEEHGSENILAILSTASCFAPRVPDNIIEIASLCKDKDIYHLVNNAYGLQTSKATHMINMGLQKRIDAFVQSTDKNFMVPVGGAIIASGSEETLDQISKTYPGRASSSPIVDLFITLLSMGKDGFVQLLEQRKEVYAYFKQQMESLAAKFGERVLQTPGNQISIAMTLDSFRGPKDSTSPSSTSTSSANASINDSSLNPSAFNASSSATNTSSATTSSASQSATHIGATLFNSCTSGIRVVIPGKAGKTVTINGYQFTGYGAHHDAFPSIYLTVAAAVGMTKADVDLTIQRMSKVLTKVTKRRTAPAVSSSASEDAPKTAI